MVFVLGERWVFCGDFWGWAEGVWRDDGLKAVSVSRFVGFLSSGVRMDAAVIRISSRRRCGSRSSSSRLGGGSRKP